MHTFSELASTKLISATAEKLQANGFDVPIAE